MSKGNRTPKKELIREFIAEQKALQAKEQADALDNMPAHFLDGLNPKETQFILNYIQDHNGSRVAREMGMGLTKDSQRSAAYALLHRPHVAAALDRVKKYIKEKLGYTLEKSIKLQFDLMNEARAVYQYIAVNPMKQHLDCLAGIYDPTRFKFEHTMKTPFNLDLTDIKTPEYAKDVTPKNLPPSTSELLPAPTTQDPDSLPLDQKKESEQ